MKQKNKTGKVKKNTVLKSSAAKRSVPQKKTAQLKRTPTNPKKASGKKPPVKGKKPLVKKEVKKAILDPDKNLQNRREFVWYIRLLEERRGINFRKTFPELVDFFNMCDRL